MIDTMPPSLNYLQQVAPWLQPQGTQVPTMPPQGMMPQQQQNMLQGILPPQNFIQDGGTINQHQGGGIGAIAKFAML